MIFFVNMNWYVYVLELCDGRYYVGSTRNIEERIKEHQNGESRYTKDKLPCRLLAYQEFDTYTEAIIKEKKLKATKSRKMIGYFIQERRKGD